MGKAKRVAIYLRVSTTGQTSFSVPLQGTMFTVKP